MTSVRQRASFSSHRCPCLERPTASCHHPYEFSAVIWKLSNSFPQLLCSACKVTFVITGR